MEKLNIKDVMVAAVELLLSRGGDVTTDDGDFAACGVDEIIRLDCAVANFLSLPSDDVNHKDMDVIKNNIKHLDAPQNEWISVDDMHKPDAGVQVLTIGFGDDGESLNPIVAHIDPNGRFISGYCFSGNRAIYMAVETFATHWMPLPTPPTQ